MDEEYELISKSVIKSLREENKKLKQEIEIQKNKKQEIFEKNENKTNKILINDIILQISSEAKKEKEAIVTILNDIKELNKKTLDNTLTRTEAIDTKLENMIETLKSLVLNLSNIIDELSKDRQKNINEDINELKQKPYQIEINNIYKKLEDIELFMNNLKILLSQIKPTDMKI